MAADILKRSHVIDIPAFRDYTSEIGKRLVAALPGKHRAWTFNVIDRGESDSLQHPEGLPGGWVFVPAGLFLAARNEAEFAGMLAHAIIHVELQLPAAWLRDPQKVSDIGTVPMVYMGGWGSENAMFPEKLAAVMRQQELDADGLAVGLLAKAGWDTSALESYIERNQKGSLRPEFTGIPPKDDRLANIRHEIQGLIQYTIAQPDDRFPGIQEMVRRAIRPPFSDKTPTLRRQPH